MKTLLHICCAPCANQCIEVLRGDGLEVTGFWYNPNIHPFTEYRSRRNCLRDYAQAIDLPLIEKNDYALRPFVREVAEDIANRCGKCYEMRLFETARQAAEGGFDSFTSSLFISPYQNHELMRETAERFLYSQSAICLAVKAGNPKSFTMDLSSSSVLPNSVFKTFSCLVV